MRVLNVNEDRNRVPVRVAAYAFVLLVLIAAPFIVSPYILHVLSTVGVAVILALGLNLLMGYAGQVSLANAAFYGIGAYAVAILGNRYGVSFWIAVPITAFATAALGFLVGLPALRVSSHYLALATLAFIWTVQVVMVDWVSMTGGAPGMSTSRSGLGIAYLQDDRSYYLVILVVTLLLIALAIRIIDSKIGRAFMAVRDNENAAELMGVNLAKYKTLAFAINAFYCAIAGGLQAGLVRFLDPSEFGLWPSIWHLLYIVVGGLGSIPGAVLGPVVLVALPETLRSFAEYRELIFASLLLLTLIYMPDGIVGKLTTLWQRIGPQKKVPTDEGSYANRHSNALAVMSQRDRKAIFLNSETVLEVVDLKVSFGGLKALQGASLSLKEGEIRALIGPNGAGKSTLLNTLSRVYTPESGVMKFRGDSLLKYKSHDLVGLGVVRTFQNIRLFGSMTLLENVKVGMHAHLRQGVFGAALWLPSTKAEERKARDRAMSLLEYVGLDNLADSKAASLSFGQQRRLELARALAADPVLLLLDEPASGLAKQEVEELRAILHSIREGLSVSILLIEHNMNFVMGIADRVSVLDHGVMIAEGTPEVIQSNSQVIEAYLGKGGALANAA